MKSHSYNLSPKKNCDEILTISEPSRMANKCGYGKLIGSYL
jgi:hypothetical protein